MQALRRKLLKRRVFVPWGSSSPFKVHLTQIPQLPDAPPPAPQVHILIELELSELGHEPLPVSCMNTALALRHMDHMSWKDDKTLVYNNCMACAAVVHTMLILQHTRAYCWFLMHAPNAEGHGRAYRALQDQRWNTYQEACAHPVRAAATAEECHTQ